MISKRLAALLLATTAAPALAQGLATPNTPAASPQAGTDSAAAPAQTAPGEVGTPAEEAVEISIPGGAPAGEEIVVTGRRIPNAIRASREVVSVLSQADIARTGEGDIAGALQRVTGLSLVGGRFIYVRGLGERYSLALLNGLPIPSPDPLRRVVPLDIFPTSIIASSLVQKSYSVNFPGEFGGGVINLTTRAVPDKPYLSIGGSIGGNTTTTGQLGYVYQGSDSDFTGFDDGTRETPRLLRAAQASGQLLAVGQNYTLRQLQDITASLTNSRTNVIQRNEDMPINWSVDFAAGKGWDVGDNRIGVVLTAGWKTDWRTREGLQQLSGGATTDGNGNPVLNADQDFRFVSTEQRTVVNGLIGVGAEIGDHRIRWNTLFVRDTLKEARIQSGTDNINVGSEFLLNRSYTNWFERQLLDTQLVGEFKWGDLSLDLRGTYANSKRRSPYERFNSYVFSNFAGDYVNDLRSPGQSSTVAFSRLNENVYGAGGDLGYRFGDLPIPVRITGGYAFTQNLRRSTRFDYRYNVNAALPIDVAQERPDFLQSDYNIYTYGIFLNTVSTIAPIYRAGLTVHAGYVQADIEPIDSIQVQGGVRFETGEEFVDPVDLFNVDPTLGQRTVIKRDYWLPAGTITWNFADGWQARLAGSKTIARPQFRELAPQTYFDPDSDRTSFGNQFLVDSELINAEGRVERYFGRDERIVVGGFYKHIDRPIEAIAFVQGGTFNTTFANAPSAELWGFEVEAQKYLPLDFIGDTGFFASRRLLVSANYTYTSSEISAKSGDTTRFPITGAVVPASDLFRDGARLVGQSEHIANLQLSLQDQDSLSEQTLLINYASDRVTNRGPSSQPDLTERPGFRLDLVARQALRIAGFNLQVKAEARNLTNTRYQEFQRLGGSRVDNNSYNLGRTFSLGVSTTF